MWEHKFYVLFDFPYCAIISSYLFYMGRKVRKMINVLGVCNINAKKNTHILKQGTLLNLSTNPLKPLTKDTVSFKGIQPKSYELNREVGSYRFYQEFPVDKENNYRVIYYTDVTPECNKNGVAPFPPSHIEFEKPVDMSLGIEICKQHLIGYPDDGLYNDNQFDILKNFLSTCDELKNEKLVSCLDVMHNTIVFELEGNRVLKMVKYNPFPENRKYEPSFDLPVLSNVYNCGDYYVFIQEKADTDLVDRENLNDVIERIKNAGYEPYDIEGNESQVGWSEMMQDYMLLDTECARVKK